MYNKHLKKAALAVALGACLGSVAPTVFAQSATGAVAGRAVAGEQITVVNNGTGLTRAITVGADGSYRLTQLPVGEYTLKSQQGELTVTVPLGGTANVNLVSADSGAATLDAVQVSGSRVVNRVDVYSTESSFNINREELARMPVAQDMTAVALLAPGVVAGNAGFGGISFGGASVAENSVFINGLNVTDFYKRQSFSAAPFAFFKEFQVKTGGYSAEFGRSTGGVINAVSRSGSNEMEGGVEVTFEPGAWKSAAEDQYYADGRVNALREHNRNSFLKTNVWASGPVIKDKVFLFAMYEQRDRDQKYTNSAGNTLTKADSNNGFWGTKLDWNINDRNLLELMAFSDEGDSDYAGYSYDYANAQITSTTPNTSTASSGGTSGSVTYTSYLTDTLTMKALYGINRSSSYSSSPVDEVCNYFTYNNASWGEVYRSMGSPRLGCHPTGSSIVSHEDERIAKRLDFEWVLGDHQLRFGWDHELMNTDRYTNYAGPNRTNYTIYGVNPGDLLDNGTVVPEGVDAVLWARERSDGGNFDIKASAIYLEDNWSVTNNLMLNIGLRMDNFENMTTTGSTFTKQDNLFSPRFGFSWDMKGDGSTKLFGNLGRYYMPIPSILSYNFAGGLKDERSYYVLGGFNQGVHPVTGESYLDPIIGAQLGETDTSYNIPVKDLRQSVDRDLDAVHQDEAILGFQQMINEAWSWGITGTYRRMTNAMDDIRINALCGVRHSNLWPIANPGDKLTLWGTQAMGCAEDGWVTIDTSKEGYMTAGSDRIIGYFKPKRTYKALEFQIDRAWDDKWAFNATYIWSKSEGNHEGPVNSDTNYGDTGMVQHWDHPANNERYGVLFNDREHQIKLRASYKFNEMWSIGSTLTAMSGGPITAFGVTWPDENLAVASYTSTGSGGGTGWLCVANCAGPWNEREYEFSGRGAFGNLPWTYNLGATLTWTLPVEGIDLKARLSVYNLLNRQEVTNISARYESQPGVMRDTFGTATGWQSPRYTQLVVSWNF